MDHVVLSGSRTAAQAADPLDATAIGATTTLKPLVVLVAPGGTEFQALRAVLGRHYRLKEYASGEQAWASLQIDGEAAALICSNRLPRMSGLELVAKLRKARLPALRTMTVCLVADTIDDNLRGRIGRQQVDFLGAWDRPLVDLAAWLRDRLAPGQPMASRRSRSDALRRWAHRHAALDHRTRESLVIFRVASEGVGVLSERLARSIRRPEMMLADALNCVWICADVPITSALRFALRLSLGSIRESDRGQARISVSYAPLLQLADETYDVLQTLVDDEPPLKHILVSTHHWKFVMPFDAARLLVK
jgi:CheY-like chemotaxis protein